MNKLLLAGAALLTLAGSAMAADMAPVYKAPIYKAPPAPVWNWTGFYIGGNVGYSWANWNSNSTAGSNFPTGTGFTDTASPSVNGWLGGPQAGYNWQVAPQWVVGLEGDFQWTGEKASDNGGTSTSFPVASVGACDTPGGCTATLSAAVTNSWSLPWFATFRGRVGVTSDQWLFYATGGLAVGEVQYGNSTAVSLTIVRTTSGTPVTTFPGVTLGTLVSSSLSESDTRVGFSLGGGIEKAIDKNWTVKAEYLYLDFGTHTFLAGSGFDTSVRLRDNIVRVGVNYKFDSGPVVARY